MAMAQPADKEKALRALEELAKGEEGLDVDTLSRIAEQMANERVDAIVRNRTPHAVEELRKRCAAYHAPAEDFKVGDIVRWKDGLKNKRTPPYDVPAIVWEVLDEPRVNPADSGGSQYF